MAQQREFKFFCSSLFIVSNRGQFLRENSISSKGRDARYDFLAGYRSPRRILRVARYRLHPLVGTRKKVSQYVSEPRSLSPVDLLDDNSLQLRVVNGGGASWFLHNLWRLVNHPIIPSPSVSLSRAASRSLTSLPSVPPVSSLTLCRFYVTLSVFMVRDRRNYGWSKIIYCCKKKERFCTSNRGQETFENTHFGLSK